MHVTTDVLATLRADLKNHQEHLNRESRYRQAHLNCLLRALELQKDAYDCQTLTETNLMMADFRSEMDDAEYYRIVAKEQTVKAETLAIKIETTTHRLVEGYKE